MSSNALVAFALAYGVVLVLTALNAFLGYGFLWTMPLAVVLGFVVGVVR